jgi:hypothetical protein
MPGPYSQTMSVHQELILAGRIVDRIGSTPQLEKVYLKR